MKIPTLICYLVIPTAHCGRIVSPLLTSTEPASFQASHKTYRVSDQESKTDLRLKARVDDDSKSTQENFRLSLSAVGEYIVLGAWISALSCFLLYNNYVQPFPSIIQEIPVQNFGLIHAVTAMLFGGGIILTTLIEWMVVQSKDSRVMSFWFQNVPDLDSKIVLPALTGLIVSGVGLAVDHYGTLGNSPYHVVASISTLLAFAFWWAATDLTTQGKATFAVEEWINGDNRNNVLHILQLRKISNIVSCLFVLTLYSIMVLKPGFSRS